MAGTVHLGKNICKIRVLLGYKQEYLAVKLGISQQSISRLERSAYIDKKTIRRYADALGVPRNAVAHFSEDGMFAYFNTLRDNKSVNAFSDTDVDLVFKLTEEIKELYERLLKGEMKKVEC